jgi:uncharacterized protein (UPF0332 family)
MNAEEIILKAIKRAKDERGLRISKPNERMSEGHTTKADHNLIVMTDLNRLGHEDWVAISAYYAMYQAALSVLSRIGLDSKEHVTTAAVLEYFFGEHISREMIETFNELKESKDRIETLTIEDRYIDYLWKAKQARETVQYGISMDYKETNKVMNNAREFVTKMKLVNSGLDEKFVSAVQKRINELKESITE